MNVFSVRKEAWYSSRDDRTKRAEEIDGIEDFSLGIIIHPKVESSYPIQVMSAIALNLLARWCRKLKVRMSAQAVSILPYTLGQNLKDSLSHELANIDPYGQFDFNNSDMHDCDQILVLGQPQESQDLAGRQFIWVDGYGWIAGVGYGFPTAQSNRVEDEPNPVGATFAACLGVAEAFRYALGSIPPKSESVWYSLYDFKKAEVQTQLKSPRYVPEFDFGRIHQIGCGAVASSLDFLIAFTQWRATVYLIDYDQVDFTNCNRCLPFYAHDALLKKDKIQACSDALRPSRTSQIRFKGDYSDFIAKNGFLTTAPDLILCLANERNIWATIQNNLPPIVLHATTTLNWGVNLGRHIPKREWCIMCRFSREIDISFHPVCGEVELKKSNSQEKPVQGVLPFLSTVAAVLILAEMAKMAMKDYPVNDDFVEFSSRNTGTQFLTAQRAAEEGCVCNEQSLDLYQKEIVTSKFWLLSSRADNKGARACSYAI